ncbi:sulfite exporter TauE/SafE family protein [Calothrix sp. PCC 6303]|uniref:urease accessory protein UreH domain-containing protein n=1 Tax=Calothrix sp. PCC 6303 TaxID=1170562 RepID=UPI0002A03411|nr:sulfite exporter TauE/SafE family protein [Calothrix sp. PCC 6303]AFY99138.1 Ferric reductase domain protein transmembrane component domain protein [Calothrix sp. PCC 6303]
MLDLWLIFTLGFLGSFGHCLGMCSPLTVAFSLSNQQKSPTFWHQVKFHTLLNLGRIFSYTAVGAAIGGVGSILFQSGQIAGIGSELRQTISVITGLMLIWFGIGHIKPDLLPQIPLLQPLLQSKLHNHLSGRMTKLAMQKQQWTPILLGMTWGFMPCGFLYVAQIKAVETGNFQMGAVTMLAFGMGTLPMMAGVGISISMVSQDQRSQLFRLSGWVTLLIGIITLLRTGDTMTDYTGHAALLCLILALIARPISPWWDFPLSCRRALGVGAYLLAVTHTSHMIEHSLQWNFSALAFLPPNFQQGMIAGVIALLLITPAAFTSFDRFQKVLGENWRKIHLLSVPALIFAVIHTILIGSHYLGSSRFNWANQSAIVLLVVVSFGVLILRCKKTKSRN